MSMPRLKWFMGMLMKRASVSPLILLILSLLPELSCVSSSCGMSPSSQIVPCNILVLRGGRDGQFDRDIHNDGEGEERSGMSLMEMIRESIQSPCLYTHAFPR